MHDVIFESDTRSGWIFDVGLLIAILISVFVTSLETVPDIAKLELPIFHQMEWLLTILFSIEYIARLSCARRPLRYALSFWGIIDVLSILPSYIGLLIPEGQAESFMMLRSIRLLRAFRVLKIWRMVDDAEDLYGAVARAKHKIVVFLMVVLVAVVISGTLMYFVETVVPNVIAQRRGLEPSTEVQFESIPEAMYWAIVTMTTVGYGDVVPTTGIGKIIAATLILLGYSLIIVPSSFVGAELKGNNQGEPASESDEGDRVAGNLDTAKRCPRCETLGHRTDAVYCFKCGERL